MKLKQYSILLIFLIATTMYADSYHNINGFFGERAPGLAGAYTAVSDDPSGAYYNPAGLAFAYDNQISISASSYNNTNKQYLNMDSPNQAYSMTSQTYMPNFMGAIKRFDNLTFAFSIVNSVNQNYNRNSQISVPVYSPTINNTRVYDMESYNQYLFGPSLAYAISNKFTIGATLYGFQDTANINKTTLQQYSDNSYVTESSVDNRRTTGLNPILGIQYMATNYLSFGLSMRKMIVMGQNRLNNSFYADSLNASKTNNLDFVEGTTKALSQVQSGNIIAQTPLNGGIPQNPEMRFGTAFFPTRNFLASFDIIHTAGYTFKQNQLGLSYGPVNEFIYNSNQVNELYRKQTTNYAFGSEYYITSNFSIMGGVFTNYANTKNIKWAESAAATLVRDVLSTQNSNLDPRYTDPSGILIPGSAGYILYRSPLLGDQARNEYVNNIGYSLGASWSTSKASITFTIVKESGRGQSRLDANSLSQPLQYNGISLYLVVSSKG